MWNKKSLAQNFQKLLYQVYTKCRSIFDVSQGIEINLPFYRPFSTFWNVSGGLCTKSFYLWIKNGFMDKSSVYAPEMEIALATTPKIMTKNYLL